MPKQTQTGVRCCSAPPKIVQIGELVEDELILAMMAAEVGDDDWDRLPDLIDLMVRAMRGNEGQALCAPQVGVSLQVISIQTRKTSARPDAEDSPLYVMVNPTITRKSRATKSMKEGCLSIDMGYDAKGNRRLLMGKVKRHTAVDVHWIDPKTRKPQNSTFSGLLAQCVQHECDHLRGVVCLDRFITPNAQHSEFV